jgi:hypothetical protein
MQGYIIGRLVTTPEAVMVDEGRVAPSLRGWARGGAAPCTVCEVETTSEWEGDIVGSSPLHTVWKVIAYGAAATVLDALRPNTALALEGVIWNGQYGAGVLGNDGVLTLHVTEAKPVHGRQERVKVTRAVAVIRENAEQEEQECPDDNEFFDD